MADNLFSDFFKKKVRVRQGCPFSPILFNVFLQNIMLDVLDGYEGWEICNGY